MSIQCKAYLLPNGAKEPSEIRSFRLDEGAASNYDYLRGKIATIFPNLGQDQDGGAFKLLSKDNSGDFITFSSDEELVDALGEIGQDGVFRVYIRQAAGKGNEFPWQSYVNELWNALNNEGSKDRPGEGSSSQPRGACGGKRGCGARARCGPQARGFPARFFVNAYPSFFPGFHAEFWGFGEDDSGTQDSKKMKSENEPAQDMDTSGPQNAEKPSTSSA